MPGRITTRTTDAPVTEVPVLDLESEAPIDVPLQEKVLSGNVDRGRLVARLVRKHPGPVELATRKEALAEPGDPHSGPVTVESGDLRTLPSLRVDDVGVERARGVRQSPTHQRILLSDSATRPRGLHPVHNCGPVQVPIV